MKRVVVTGMGAVTPIGNSVEEFWDNIKKNFTKNISFLIQGETQIIAEKESVLSYYKTDEGKTDFSRICVCLVTGEKCQPVKTFTKIQLGKFSDTKLVSFQKNQGYDSYGKEQGNNAYHGIKSTP